MSYDAGLAAISMVAPAIGTALLYRRYLISHDRLLQLLAAFVTFQILALLPVQIIGVCQILGLVQRVTLFEIAVFQLLILAAIAVGIRSPNPPKPVARWEPVALHNRSVKRAIAVSAGILLLSHLVFVINLLTSYPAGWDGLAYHLPLSLRWLQDGSLGMPPSRAWEFSMPGNTEIGMMLLLATGSQALSPLFNTMSLIVLGLAVYLIARKCGGGATGPVIAVLILFSIPLFQFHAYSTYVDLAGTAFLMASMALFLHRYEHQNSHGNRLSWPIVAFSGIACGISIGTKPVFYAYTAVLLLMALVLLVAEKRYPKQHAILVVLILGLSAAVPSAFWFWRAFHTTGNPIYPLEVSVAGHKLYEGFPSSAITPTDIVQIPTSSSPLGWLLYPWKEQITSYGILVHPPYSLDSGLGAAFATFVPLGLAFFLYRSLRRGSNKETVVLMLTWLVMLGLWWFELRHYPRFGMPIWALGCALATPLLEAFSRSDSKIFPWLLSASVLVTCSISAFSPLHEIIVRLRSGDWTRSGYYQYPTFIDQLPAGSRVLNRANDFNFILAGNHLTNRVIPPFESPPDVNPKYLAEAGIDYVVESSDEGNHFLDLRAAGGQLVHEDRLPIGETGRWREWHIWRITPPGRP